jgi:hypothetical protein
MRFVMSSMRNRVIYGLFLGVDFVIYGAEIVIYV